MSRYQWEKEHPNFCRNCSGLSEIVWWDLEPAEIRPCEACVGQGDCPWCGEHLLETLDESTPVPYCGNCGWSHFMTIPEDVEDTLGELEDDYLLL